MRSLAIVLLIVPFMGCGGGGGSGDDNSDTMYDGTWTASVSSGTLTFAVQGDQVLGGEYRTPPSSDFPIVEYLGISDPIEDSAFAVSQQSPSDHSEWYGSFSSPDSASGMVTIMAFDETEYQFVFETRSWTAEKVNDTPMVGLYLTFVSSGLASVSVVPASPDFSCTEGTCSGYFPAGSEITLVPETCPGCTFQGWGNTDKCTGTGPCTLTLDHYLMLIVISE